MSVPDSDLYPTITYRDPLLHPLYIRTNDSMSIWLQSQGDWLLNAYITKLNNEIVSDIPEFAEHKPLVQEILDKIRIFGYCAVQPYQDKFRVFSPLEWAGWISAPGENGKNERVGMNAVWSDDLGNAYHEQIYFQDLAVGTEVTSTDPVDQKKTVSTIQEEPDKAYLFIWEAGNGRQQDFAPQSSAFAIADLNKAILSLAIQCRQLQGALIFSATNPYFYHFVYGDSITQAQRTALMNQMSYVNVTNGIGAKEGVLKEIRVIENGSTEKTIVALDQCIRFYAAETRLPLEFYLGEKQTGGLGDTGQVEDDNEVEKKKGFILGHIESQLSAFFEAMGWGPLKDIGQFYIQKAEKRKAEMQQNELALKGNDKNGAQVQK